MGVKLLGKIKIHEIAKELNLTSKEIIERATKLGIDVKNHLSSVEEDVAKILKDSFKKVIKETKTSEEQASNEKKTKKEKTETPVIIRREVIISDEEIAKKEEQEKKRKQEEKNKQVGFVERNTNKDFNIVYRNKPTKPLTVSELFGLKTEKKEEKVEKVEEKPKEQVEVQETKVTQETKSVAKEQPVQKQAESSNEVEETRNVRNSNYRNNNQIGGFNNQGRNFNNQNNNGYNQNRNNGYRNNNQNGGYNNQGRNFNNQNNNGYNQNRNNGYRNNNQNGGYNNQGRNFNNQNNNGYNQNRNNGYRNNDGFNRRPLDEKGIEKNIKNIMTDVVEKEQVREYNKSIDKQKQNRFEENKAKKPQKQRRGGDNFDEDKLKSLKQRDRLSNMFDEQDGGMLDFYDLTTQRGKKNKKRANKQEDRVKQKIFELTEITITDPITVKDFAAEMKKTTADVIKKLLGFGVLATINNEIDFDTAFLIAEEFGITAKKKETITEEDILFDDSEDKETDLKPRPPVVVVMGHVDHGKTSLLDAVRQTNVIEGEAGGITQHIGAYKVKIKDREITFLDTPGHEAFTSMRARGAQVTDIAILVVAANDGVMPQTIEAINHAKAAEIPIIVALNKIDVEGANPEKVKQELTKYDLVPEEWGGDTIFVEISAKKKLNIDTLLEMVLLVADMKELKANPNKQSKGTVLEAKLDKARGPVVSMLVQRGTLDIGDTIVVGSTIGRIRAMTDDKGKKVKKAGPSTPVEITGLTEVPEAGDTFYEVKDEKTAKHLIEMIYLAK